MGVNVRLNVRATYVVKVQFSILIRDHFTHLLVQICPIWTFSRKKLKAIAITIDEGILLQNK
jgi:hypothetical protein